MTSEAETTNQYPQLTLEVKVHDFHGQRMLNVFCPELNFGLGLVGRNSGESLGKRLVNDVDQGIEKYIEDAHAGVSFPEPKVLRVAEGILAAKQAGVSVIELFRGKK